MAKTLELTDHEHKKLCDLLDKAGDKLREIEGDAEAEALADGCDHWLEIVEMIWGG